MDKESISEKLQYLALAAGIDYDALEKKYEKRVSRVINLANPKKIAVKLLVKAALIILATFIFALIGGIVFNSLAFTLLAFIISVFGMVFGVLFFIIRGLVVSVEKLIRESVALSVEFACDFVSEVDGSEYNVDMAELIKYFAYGIVVPKTGEVVKRVILFAGDIVALTVEKSVAKIIDETAKMAEMADNVIIKSYIGLKKGFYKEVAGEAIVSEAACLYSSAGAAASMKVRELSQEGFDRVFEKVGIDSLDERAWEFLEKTLLKEDFSKEVDKTVRKYIKKITGKIKLFLTLISGGFLGLITIQALLLVIVVIERAGR